MSLKGSILALARSAGLAAAARKATRGQLRILAYHGLWVTPGYQFGNCLFQPPEHFAARMRKLRQSGHPVLPLGEAVDRLAEGALPPGAVAITIDDGWVSTFTHMLPVLEAYELPATLYATTWYSGRALPVVNLAVDYLRAAGGRLDIEREAVLARIESLPAEERLEALRAFGRELGVSEAWFEHRQFNIMSAGEFAEAHQRGLDVQLHTHRHIDLAEEVDALPREIEENRAFLESALGKASLEHFCYPSGSTHPRAREVLAAKGIRSGTLVTRGLNDAETDPLALRRFLDGRSISDAEFDAYLSGVLHYTDKVRRLVRRPSSRGKYDARSA